MPEVAPPKAAPAHSDPYGLGQVRQTGPISVTTTAPASVQNVGPRVDNRVAWISLLFGLVAVGLTLAPALPGSTLWWVAGAAVIALVTAVAALAGRFAGTSTNVVSPAIGVVLGAGATIMVVMGVGILGLVNGALVPTDSSTTTSASVRSLTSTEPLVFSANPALTASGQVVQTIATAMNHTYADGKSSLAAGQSWPASVKFTATEVVAADGTVIATIPAGHVLGYTRSADGESYQFTVSATNPSEVAVYNSAANRFGFRCLASDTNCVPSR
jgi:hypothetical protein